MARSASKLGASPLATARWLRDGRAPLYAYIPAAWAISVIGSLLLAMFGHWLLPAAPSPDLVLPNKLLLFGLLVLFAPLTETLIMSLPLLLLEPRIGRARAAWASAILWGIAHSLAAPAWGISIWWSFLIFSTAFMAWRGRGGYWVGIGVAAAIHALQNAIVASALLTG